MKTFWLETTHADNQYIWEEREAKKLVLRAYKSAGDSDWILTNAGLHKELKLELDRDDIKVYEMKPLSKDEAFLELL